MAADRYRTRGVLATSSSAGAVSFDTWGVNRPHGGLARLSLGARRLDRDLGDDDIRRSLLHADGALRGALPPFGAILLEGHTVRATTDWLGFQQLYLSERPGTAAISTSARALAQRGPPPLDHHGVASQSLLGWQIGDTTMFEGVRTLPAGARVELSDGRAEVEAPDTGHDDVEARSTRPEQVAASLLRTYLEAYLDDHPDTTLQLTGGLDSRILLAAIPPARRRGLATMTLRVPGSEDVEVASAIAARWGLQHHVLDDRDDPITSEEAFRLAVTAAARVDGMADPLALATVDRAELSRPAGLVPSARLSGLGGEVARGFYYFGPPLPVAVTRRRVRRLADWRLFPNEAAPPAMFAPDFASWRYGATVDALHGHLTAGDRPWPEATDGFYLHHRMRRWAGVLASANAPERVVVNPMLDHRFIDLVTALPPSRKADMGFLARLLMALDPELATIPMDGRPAPQVYARRSPAGRVRLLGLTGRKVGRKVRQRLGRSHPVARPGLDELVLAHLRSHPEVIAPLFEVDLLRADWLEDDLLGPGPLPHAALAMVISLLACCSAPPAVPGPGAPLTGASG